ncbi:hypothetical protein FXB40_01140 [Bradyrhizobium rifense]|uniref:Uncharacterized protein n=1 Tax=Bradyrhizobium rifense TaxID=515499 RepID=A0A5D3L1V1_9BRAD|nr:hypothetical protein [Bradyrhizobium rifense]TYM00143.1 hypothetical protein FXB40_01140 [Bradyrhizobium rifense]
MSTWYQEDVDGPLLEETIRIAWNYLQCSGEIEDQDETARILTRKIGLMMEQGQRNRLVLSP